jgi:hypothetical protein
MFKFFFVNLFLVLVIYEWQWGCWKFTTFFRYVFGIWSFKKINFMSAFIFHCAMIFHVIILEKLISYYIFICWYWVLFVVGIMFVDCMTLFATLQRRKWCWLLIFLFQDGANVVTYLTMDNLIFFNTNKHWPYL